MSAGEIKNVLKVINFLIRDRKCSRVQNNCSLRLKQCASSSTIIILEVKSVHVREKVCLLCLKKCLSDREND